METSSGSGVIYTKERKGMRMENPFTLKVAQVFTGFGIGCGVGIGVGRPLNLGAIPVLNQVIVATRGATDAFSGVQGHVNNSLRKVGAKNIEAGIGCGVGFGHGFGAGLAVKPGVLLQLQSQVLHAITGIIIKLGIGPTLPANHGLLPLSLLTGMNMVTPSHENTEGSISQLVKSVPNSTNEGNIGDRKTKISSGNTTTPKGSAINPQYSSRTETVIDNFMKSSLLKDDGSSAQEQAGRQQLENNMLQMVLKHQLIIEKLMRENEKLRQVLVEELKVQPSKFESSFSSSSRSSCSECFECRRKQRKR